MKYKYVYIYTHMYIYIYIMKGIKDSARQAAAFSVFFCGKVGKLQKKE